MGRHSRLILSNRTELLYEELKLSLYRHGHPFTKRKIVVPSSAMKSWLMLQMATDPEISIAAGIEVGFLEPTLNSLITTLDETDSSKKLHLPTQLEVACAIEAVIRTAADHSHPAWQPVMRYLGVKAGLSRQAKRRLVSLSLLLAEYFKDYGIYGGKMLSKWNLDKASGGWQSLLWHELEKVFEIWGYPSRRILQFKMSHDFAADDLQLHVFGHLRSIY